MVGTKTKKVKGAKSLTVRPHNMTLASYFDISFSFVNSLSLGVDVDSQQQHVLGCDKLGQGQLAHPLHQRLAKVFLSYISI